MSCPLPIASCQLHHECSIQSRVERPIIIIQFSIRQAYGTFADRWNP